MKNLNFLLSVLVALSTLVYVGCSEEGTTEDATLYKSMELGMSLNVVNPEQSAIATRSDALTGDDVIEDEVSSQVPYCDKELASGDSAVAIYDVVFYDENDVEVGTRLQDQVWSWKVKSNLIATDATLSELRQFDYPATAEKAILTISDFRVFEAGTTTIKYITPRDTSAYAGYVAYPVDAAFTIDLYEKQYIKMDVLCFEEKDIPKFGFAWADFDVIIGQEVCMFFNCIESESDSLQHQAVRLSMEALFYSGLTGGNEIYSIYWTGSNQTDNGTQPVCVLCPGNWDQFHAEGDAGFQMIVTTAGGTQYTIMITKEQIQAYLDGDTDEVWTIAGVGILRIDEAGGIPFMHYIFDDCDDLISGQI